MGALFDGGATGATPSHKNDALPQPQPQPASSTIPSTVPLDRLRASVARHPAVRFARPERRFPPITCTACNITFLTPPEPAAGDPAGPWTCPTCRAPALTGSSGVDPETPQS